MHRYISCIWSPYNKHTQTHAPLYLSIAGQLSIASEPKSVTISVLIKHILFLPTTSLHQNVIVTLIGASPFRAQWPRLTHAALLS